jgi:2-polyprenyl-3-methyl-5-hydroxy-6-metoxy-1,4-benzoquinol methylase
MPYGEDLAYVHDVAFTDLARNAARTVLKLLRERKIAGGLVVDLGCGSGVLAERLMRAGYDVLGVDVSGAMLRLARKRAPKCSIRAWLSISDQAAGLRGGDRNRRVR